MATQILAWTAPFTPGLPLAGVPPDTAPWTMPSTSPLATLAHLFPEDCGNEIE